MDRTDQLIAKDLKHIWHPFTQQKIWPAEPPLVIEKAEGNWLLDTRGRRYFDGVSSLWVTVHGHNHPRLVAAIEEQLKNLDHSTMLGLTHPKAVELGEALTGMTPRTLSRVFYSESGSTAVEIGLKIAYQYWQIKGQRSRRTFVALQEAYHGDTLGAVSVGGMELFHEVYRPLLFDVFRLPQPHCRRCPLGLSHPGCGLACANRLEDILRERGKEICALVLEPKVQGAAGMIVQPQGYLTRLWEIARRHGILIMADEVATGFGRTGSMFACELEGTDPDIMCLGKGLTGGMLPLSATLTSEEIYSAFLGEFDEFKHFFHGHTYTGNPLAAAAALANLELMAENRILDNVRQRARQMAEGLKPLLDLEHVAQIRQQGMMAGIELVEDKASDKSYDPALRMGHRVIMAARQREVIIRPLGDTVILMPPLSSSREEIDHLLKAVRESIAQVTEG